MISRVFAVSGVAIALFSGMAFAQQENLSGAISHSYVQFVPLNTVKVMRGQNIPLEFRFHVKSGYHINSSRPTTPELIPTSLGFTPPEDFVIARVQYPEGELTSFPFDPTQKLSVYSGDVVVKAVIITQPGAPSGTYTIHGDFKYQACDNNACYPPKKLPVQFNVNLSKGTGRKRQSNRQSPHIHY
jgi:hypothetical protein